jgi:glycosyltransferase involved in cell wall biosynthesis
MHAFTEPDALRPLVRWYRRRGYPHTAEMADAVIINSESLRRDVERYLDVDPAKLRLIPEAVDHELFFPGDPDEARAVVARTHGVTRPFVLFVSSLWPYKNCEALLRAFASLRTDLPEHQLVVVGSPSDAEYAGRLRGLADSLGIADDVVWTGGLDLAATVPLYRAADVFVYPSFNETFGLPLLEAMACACPVVTSDRSAMPETAGGAALLTDPDDPATIAAAVLEAVGPRADELRKKGRERAGEFTWATTAARTLEVYREVHRARQERRA